MILLKLFKLLETLKARSASRILKMATENLSAVLYSVNDLRMVRYFTISTLKSFIIFIGSLMDHHLFQENRPIPRPKKNGNGITKVLYLLKL